MGSHHNHWPPNVDEPVTIYPREDEGKNPYGLIVDVDEDCEEITVLFYGDSIDFSQRGVVRINTIAYPAIITVLCPETLYPGSDTEVFTFDDFHHCWSSHSGGQGRWIINDR